MALLNDFMASQQSKFLKCVAAAPTSQQSELTGAWYTASSKLIGNLLVYSNFKFQVKLPVTQVTSCLEIHMFL